MNVKDVLDYGALFFANGLKRLRAEFGFVEPTVGARTSTVLVYDKNDREGPRALLVLIADIVDVTAPPKVATPEILHDPGLLFDIDRRLLKEHTTALSFFRGMDLDKPEGVTADRNIPALALRAHMTMERLRRENDASRDAHAKLAAATAAFEAMREERDRLFGQAGARARSESEAHASEQRAAKRHVDDINGLRIKGAQHLSQQLEEQRSEVDRLQASLARVREELAEERAKRRALMMSVVLDGSR